MSTVTVAESNAAKAVVRRNTEEVQGKGGFNVFDELFAEDFVTTYKTNHETHDGEFLGIAPTHREIHFETVDVMRVQTVKAPTLGRRQFTLTHATDWRMDAESRSISVHKSLG